MIPGFGYLYKSVMFHFLFLLKKQKIIDSKKASWPKFCNIIFLFLLKIGSVGPVEQQINLASSYTMRNIIVKIFCSAMLRSLETMAIIQRDLLMSFAKKRPLRETFTKFLPCIKLKWKLILRDLYDIHKKHKNGSVHIYCIYTNFAYTLLSYTVHRVIISAD